MNFEEVFIDGKLCRLVTEDSAVGDTGILYTKDSEGNWSMGAESPNDYIHQANSRIDRRFETQLLERVGDALSEDGTQIYIRVVEGRLMWIRANVHGGGEKWEELTPALAKDRQRVFSNEESLEMLRDKLAGVQPELYEIGWYQNTNGDLYQFDGKTWVGTQPSKMEIKTLEYLG